MKKLLLIILFGTLICPPCFADNKSRISELQKEGQKLLDEVSQYQLEISRRNLRIVEIQGAVKELNLMDSKDTK